MEALTIAQACELAAISRSSFYRLLDDPTAGLANITLRIPGMRCIRIPRHEFLQWLQSRPLKPRRRNLRNPLDSATSRGM
jgi:predicted DNA-binding transcriptional regulator AlpA